MRGISAVTKNLINAAYQVLEENHPQTLRQVHYEIFSKQESLELDGYENDVMHYRKLGNALLKARRLYRQWELDRKKKGKGASEPSEFSIPGDWVVDELRQGEHVTQYTDFREYAQVIRYAYRRDLWQDQPHYIEIWGEKATVLVTLRPIAREFGLTLRVCRGFGSGGMEDELGRLFEEVHKPITIFYIGDHDASGVAIDPDMHRRVQKASGKKFKMVRLAIFAEDIQKFKLPPQLIKEDDTRAAAFRKKFGHNARTVELEALPVAELRRRIQKAFRRLIDFERWNRQLEIQELELNSIEEYADNLENLPQSEA